MKNSNFEPVWFWGLDPGSISRIIKALLYARSSNPTVVMCLKTSSLHHHQRNIIRKTWHQDQTVNAPSISRILVISNFLVSSTNFLISCWQTTKARALDILNSFLIHLRVQDIKIQLHILKTFKDWGEANSGPSYLASPY